MTLVIVIPKVSFLVAFIILQISCVFITFYLLFTCMLRGTPITLTGQFYQRILYLGVSFQVITQFFTCWLGSVIFILLLYSTLTATTFDIYALIDIRICSGFTSATFGVLTLTVALTGAMLGICQRVAGWVLAVMLVYNGFIVCTVCVPYNFIAFLICLSLSSTMFWFLLCLNQSF